MYAKMEKIEMSLYRQQSSVSDDIFCGWYRKPVGAHSSIKTSTSVYKATLFRQNPVDFKRIPGKRAHTNSSFGEPWAMLNPCGTCSRKRQFTFPHSIAASMTKLF